MITSMRADRLADKCPRLGPVLRTHTTLYLLTNVASAPIQRYVASLVRQDAMAGGDMCL
jgi:hypothetical protein